MDPVVRIVPFIVALEVNLLLSRQAGSLKKHAPVGTFETYPLFMLASVIAFSCAWLICENLRFSYWSVYWSVGHLSVRASLII